MTWKISCVAHPAGAARRTNNILANGAQGARARSAIANPCQTSTVLRLRRPNGRLPEDEWFILLVGLGAGLFTARRLGHLVPGGFE